MSVTARPGVWTVDPQESAAEFTVRNLLFKTVRGSFPIRTATLTVDEGGRPRSLTAVLAADGFETGNPKRDTHVRGKDFLAAQAHPDLSFTSTAITPVGPDTWRIEGDLTVRGTTSRLVLDAAAKSLDVDRAEVTAAGTLKRHAAGVAYGPTFMVGKDIGVELTVVLRPGD